MEYQKIINSPHDKTNPLSEFRTRNLVEINDEWRGTYNKLIKLNLKLQW